MIDVPVTNQNSWWWLAVILLAEEVAGGGRRPERSCIGGASRYPRVLRAGRAGGGESPRGDSVTGPQPDLPRRRQLAGSEHSPTAPPLLPRGSPETAKWPTGGTTPRTS